MRAGVRLFRAWRGGRSQAEVGALIGVSQNAVSKWEAGATPGLEYLVKIAAASGGAVPIESWATEEPEAAQ